MENVRAFYAGSPANSMRGGPSSAVETQPQALPAALLVDVREPARVRFELVGTRSRHRERAGGSRRQSTTRSACAHRGVAVAAELQHRLAPVIAR